MPVDSCWWHVASVFFHSSRWMFRRWCNWTTFRQGWNLHRGLMLLFLLDWMSKECTLAQALAFGASLALWRVGELALPEWNIPVIRQKEGSWWNDQHKKQSLSLAKIWSILEALGRTMPAHCVFFINTADRFFIRKDPTDCLVRSDQFFEPFGRMSEWNIVVLFFLAQTWMSTEQSGLCRAEWIKRWWEWPVASLSSTAGGAEEADEFKPFGSEPLLTLPNTTTNGSSLHGALLCSSDDHVNVKGVDGGSSTLVDRLSMTDEILLMTIEMSISMTMIAGYRRSMLGSMTCWATLPI